MHTLGKKASRSSSYWPSRSSLTSLCVLSPSACSCLSISLDLSAARRSDVLTMHPIAAESARDNITCLLQLPKRSATERGNCERLVDYEENILFPFKNSKRLVKSRRSLLSVEREKWDGIRSRLLLPLLRCTVQICPQVASHATTRDSQDAPLYPVIIVVVTIIITRRIYWGRLSIQHSQASTSAWWRHCPETVFPRQLRYFSS